MIALAPLDRAGLASAQDLVTRYHYLGKPVDPRGSLEGYSVLLGGTSVGILILGRAQAPNCYPWYGSWQDVHSGRAEVTRWQVLNLARVWLSTDVQRGGLLYSPEHLPGFIDRRGTFRSTLASEVLGLLAGVVVRDYLVRRPPCFLDEPYALRWLLSYCDTRLHRGTIYRAAGWELFRENRDGIQTWRYPLRSLCTAEDEEVREAARLNPRSRTYRARRAQTELSLVGGGL